MERVSYVCSAHVERQKYLEQRPLLCMHVVRLFSKLLVSFISMVNEQHFIAGRETREREKKEKILPARSLQCVADDIKCVNASLTIAHTSGPLMTHQTCAM